MIKKQKIAILGGGLSAISACYYLTDRPEDRARYEVTVYQQGWRLGGKAASGRDPKDHDRILEHGLHIMFGCYGNVFRWLEGMYGENNRPPGAPLATWQEALKPHTLTGVIEHIENDWIPWQVVLPEDDKNPAKLEERFTWSNAVSALVKYLHLWAKQLDFELKDHPDFEEVGFLIKHDLVPHLLHLGLGLERVAHEAHNMAAHSILERLPQFADHAGKRFRLPSKYLVAAGLMPLGFLLQAMQTALAPILRAVEPELESHTSIRRLAIGIDTTLAIMLGLIRDNVVIKGLWSLNDIDFSDWMRKHGANEDLTINGGAIRGLYDLGFAYKNGDRSVRDMEAGVMLRSIFGLFLCYNGGFMYKMQAGMGDTIFGPAYEVLKKRGVKFKFFHEVTEVIAGGDQVTRVVLREQARLKKGLEAYTPLVDVKGLPCWPAAPLLEQLSTQDAKLIRDHGVDLENFWSNWDGIYEAATGTPLPRVTLEQGRDFDELIYAMPVATIPFLATSLMQQDPAFDMMAKNLITTPTQAAQVWLRKSVHESGYQIPAFANGQLPIVSGFTVPFDTWAVMDQLIDKETWPHDNMPQNCSYFCSVLDAGAIAPPDQQDYQQIWTDQVKANAIKHLTEDMLALWPNFYNDGAFDWSLLMGKTKAKGVKRFDSQYWRANVSPSERYTLCAVGTSKYRLGPKGTRFKNLTLAGDWTDNPVQAGSAEGAVMSGLQASQSLCGHPREIIGAEEM